MDALLGSRLKSLRKAHHKTQQNVADDLLLTRSAYTYYELGHSFPSLAVLYQLAEYYGVSTDFLLGRQGSLQPMPLHDGTAGKVAESPAELPLPQNKQEENMLLRFRVLSPVQQKLLLQWLDSMSNLEK